MTSQAGNTKQCVKVCYDQIEGLWHLKTMPVRCHMGRWRNVFNVADPREGCEATIANSPEWSSMTCVSFGLPVAR